MSRLDDLRAEVAREEALAAPAVISVKEKTELYRAAGYAAQLVKLLGMERDASRGMGGPLALKTIEALNDRIAQLEQQANREIEVDTGTVTPEVQPKARDVLRQRAESKAALKKLECEVAELRSENQALKDAKDALHHEFAKRVGLA